MLKAVPFGLLQVPPAGVWLVQAAQPSHRRQTALGTAVEQLRDAALTKLRDCCLQDGK